MFTKKKIKYFLLSLFVLLLVGCATTGSDSLRLETEETVSNRIKIGTTTKDEIREYFGAPLTTSFTSEGADIWTYELSRMQSNIANLHPYSRILLGGATGVKKTLTVLFDDNDKVRRFNMSESDVKSRTGILNQ